jgi:hypothetical protein
MWWEYVGWIYLALDPIQQRSFVNTIMRRLVLYVKQVFVASWLVIICREGVLGLVGNIYEHVWSYNGCHGMAIIYC